MLATLDNSNTRLTRRRFAVSAAASFLSLGTASAIEYPPVRPSEPFRFFVPVPDVFSQVTPKAGVPTGVAFGNSIQTLIAAGVIDPDKFRASTTNLPEWVERVLSSPSDEPIVFSEQTAFHLVNLLWPLGLANKVPFNENSPIRTLRISGFASTGGWRLGREKSGHFYFNQVDAIHMTEPQAAVALNVATTTFRPCCNNSTFFQDCNHGSALLGLLELAASQGATVEGLYGIALKANSFWFPDYYAQTALYFAHFHRKSWSDVAPSVVLGSDFSSLSGWEKNVSDPLEKANIQLPGNERSQQAC